MQDVAPIRTVSLWGEGHTIFGDVAAEAIGEDVAVAISRGKYPKGYPHLDPNEDAVLAATSGPRTLLAVADGHLGFDAARAALTAVEMQVPNLLLEDAAVDDRIRDTLRSARHRVGAALSSVPANRSASGTTLALAVLSGNEVSVAGFGDSQVVLVRPGGSYSLWGPAPFLRPGGDVDAAWASRADINEGDWILAASDGLVDFLGRGWLDRLEGFAKRADAEGLVRRAVEGACDGGAGDNVAVAAARARGV